jgi:hypothetical protein
MNSKEILFNYKLTDQEKDSIMKYDFDLASKAAQKSICKTIISVLENGIKIREDRTMFADTRMKNEIVRKLANNRRYSESTRSAFHSNYFHYSVVCLIRRIELGRRYGVYL